MSAHHSEPTEGADRSPPRKWTLPLQDYQPAPQPLEATPLALVGEARRLADDLCRHWEETGEKPCVQDVAGWLPETVVSDLWSLANAVEEAWRATLDHQQDDPKTSERGSIQALVDHAQRLLRRIQRVLEERFSHVAPLDPALLEPHAEAPWDNHQLGELVDALQDHLRMAETFNDELSEQERLGPHWLEEGREIVDLLMREIRPEPGRPRGERRANRLQTLAVRLQSLILLARQAASDYSVEVGFAPQTEPSEGGGDAGAGPGEGHPR